MSFAPYNSTNAAICAEGAASDCVCIIPVKDYDLAATLDSGQTFRWQWLGVHWESVVAGRWVELKQHGDEIHAHTAAPQADWSWLRNYLQVDVELQRILDTFPRLPVMDTAVRRCRGLRLLRQEVWECLACFILSSTKQIMQIKQIVRAVCERYGSPIETPPGRQQQFSFPSAQKLAAASELELRACRMGFRAPYLLETAKIVAAGDCRPDDLANMPLSDAREHLMQLPGVGRKIADCILLFACGFQAAFPIDVWVARTLRRDFFPGRKLPARQLQELAGKSFGPYAGYAQQYLFHHARLIANGTSPESNHETTLRS